MFDKNKFAQILKNINDTYESQRDFSKKSGINRTYLSQYMNMRLDDPPKPNTLKRLSEASHNLISYSQLMNICGYTDQQFLYKIFLEENYKEIEEDYLNKLYEIKLTKEEEEVYQDIFSIIQTKILDNFTMLEVKENLHSYIDNIDFLTTSSKEKVISKLMLFIEYCRETEKARAKIYDTDLQIKNFAGKTNDNISQYYMVAVYGRISAGQPNWAEECIEGRLPIDPVLFNIINPEEHFFLRVNGESMNKVIRNGAYALIHKQDIVENGEIAVVLVNGDEATLKKFSKQGELIVLEPMSNDNSFQVQVYDKTTPIKVLGKYVGKFEMNK